MAFWHRREAKTSASPMVALSDLQSAVWTGDHPARQIKAAFRENPIAWRCLRMVVDAAASIPLKRPESPEGDDLARLFGQAVFSQGLARQIEALHCDLQTNGNAFLEAVMSDDTRIAGLQCVPASSVEPVGQNGWKIRTRNGYRPVAPLSNGWMPILHLKMTSPGGGRMGDGPLKAAMRPVDIHNAGSNWAKSLIDNAARPSGALIYGQDGGRLTEEQFTRLKSQLESAHTGSSNAGRPLLLEGGLDWKPMSLSPTDMDFIEARREAAREIALAFGVPPMLLGIPGDNTYSNYREANLAFWRLTILPLARKVETGLSDWLSSVLPEAQKLKLDLESLPAFAMEREALWSRLEKASFLDREEKRLLAGLEPSSC